MKSIILSLSLLLASAHAAENASPLDGYRSFFSLSKTEAETKAAALAKNDFEAGTYRILVFGLRPAPEHDAYVKHLKAYGIECQAIAGCIVSDGILGAAEGYNGVMKSLLMKKLGKDLFEEFNHQKK